MSSKEFHVAVFPWFAVGHITPFLHLSNKLAERGWRVSFFIPTKTRERFNHLNLHPHLIHFIPLTVPQVDGLPPGTETMSDVPMQSNFFLLLKAFDLTKDQVQVALHDLQPNAVIFEFPHWLPRIAHSLGIKCIFYSTASASVISSVFLPSMVPLSSCDEKDEVGAEPTEPDEKDEVAAEPTVPDEKDEVPVEGNEVAAEPRGPDEKDEVAEPTKPDENDEVDAKPTGRDEKDDEPVEPTVPDEKDEVAAEPRGPDEKGEVVVESTATDEKGEVAAEPTAPHQKDEVPVEGNEVAAEPRGPDEKDGVAVIPTAAPDEKGEVAVEPTAINEKGEVAAEPTAPEDKEVSFFDREAICLRESDVICFRGYDELDGEFCDQIKEQLNKQVLLVGMSLPELSNDPLEERWAKWLGGFDKESVVYCAFGSECVLEKDQFQELILGLELTGFPFLARLRPPSGVETVEEALPEGFKERVGVRGIVHGGWVQQQQILSHPSVGCFVSHCGYGSMCESLVSTCQIVLIPQVADQFLNANYITTKLKVGVEVERREEDKWFTREGVCKAVKMVMDEGSEVGKEIRVNHHKLKEFLSTEGLESTYLDKFVHKLQEILE